MQTGKLKTGLYLMIMLLLVQFMITTVSAKKTISSDIEGEAKRLLGNIDGDVISRVLDSGILKPGITDMPSLMSHILSHKLRSESKSHTIGSSLIEESAGDEEECHIVKLTGIPAPEVMSVVEEIMRKVSSKIKDHVRVETEAEHDGFAVSVVCFKRSEQNSAIATAILSALNPVHFIERDEKVKAGQVQKDAPWNLAVLNDPKLFRPLKAAGEAAADLSSTMKHPTFTFGGVGKGIPIYVVDSGVDGNHPELSGRVRYGYSVYGEGGAGEQADCAGHGTQVASAAAGLVIGVAKQASIIDVQILDCQGEGRNSDIIKALSWILADGKKGSGGGAKGIINMSVGGPRSKVVDLAIKAASDAGFLVVAAAGNESEDACTQSPGGSPLVLSVGATSTSLERSYFSNYGKCVTLFAPGENIVVASAGVSAKATSSTKYSFSSGTSFSSPLVAGVAALLLEANPGDSPDRLKARILSGSVSGAVRGRLLGTTNLFLQAPAVSKDLVNQEFIELKLGNGKGGQIPRYTVNDIWVARIEDIMLGASVVALGVAVIIGLCFLGYHLFKRFRKDKPKGQANAEIAA